MVFPKLKLIFHVKQGQAIAFWSSLLIYGNLLITSGKRHSIVFYIHKSFIKQERPFTSLDISINETLNSNNSDNENNENKK